MERGNKKGQVTIFVVLAIVIVAIIVIFFLLPQGPTLFKTGEVDPFSFLRDCIEPEVRSGISLLSAQGGYRNPQGTVTYQGDEVKYLCYTNKDYKTCTVQQPLIKTNFEKELNSIVKPVADLCMSNLIAEYEKRNYVVSSGDINSEIFIAPGHVVASFDSPLTVTREESSQGFDGFEVIINSEMYNLLFIATSIVDFESTFGDSETTVYLQYYPDLSIHKVKLSDGSTIYTLSNVVTDETFRFASRSLAWPPGYGI